MRRSWALLCQSLTSTPSPRDSVTYVRTIPALAYIITVWLSQEGSCSWLLRVACFLLQVEVSRNRDAVQHHRHFSALHGNDLFFQTKLCRFVWWGRLAESIVSFKNNPSLENSLFMMIQNGKLWFLFFSLEVFLLFSSVLSHVLGNQFVSLPPSHWNQKVGESVVAQYSITSRKAVSHILSWCIFRGALLKSAWI